MAFLVRDIRPRLGMHSVFQLRVALIAGRTCLEFDDGGVYLSLYLAPLLLINPLSLQNSEQLGNTIAYWNLYQQVASSYG